MTTSAAPAAPATPGSDWLALGLTPEAAAAVDRAVETKAMKVAEAVIADRMKVAPERPVTSGARDRVLDPSDPSKDAAAKMGWRLMNAYYEQGVIHRQAAGLEKPAESEHPKFKALRNALVRAKATGQFLSIFDQGGSLHARETVSSDLIDFLRPASVFLRMPGSRQISGYGSKLVVGRLDSGATAYWVGENEAATTSDVGTGQLVLGAHKAMALVPVSNDIMRLGTGDAAAIVGQDAQLAMGDLFDSAAFNGTGAAKPQGIYTLTHGDHTNDIAGTSVQNKVDDLLSLPKLIEQAYIPGAMDGVYVLPTETYYHLMGLRATDVYVFPELRNLNSPTLNGRPVVRTTKLEDAGTGGNTNVIGYGIPSEIYVGEGSSMEVTIGETSTDFSKDMMTVRVISYLDVMLRRSKAWAWLINSSY